MDITISFSTPTVNTPLVIGTRYVVIYRWNDETRIDVGTANSAFTCRTRDGVIVVALYAPTNDAAILNSTKWLS